MNRKLLFPFFVGLFAAFIADGQVPVPTISAGTALSGCGPLVVSFIGSATNGPITSWSWNFGGVPPDVSTGTSNLQNPIVVFNTPGNYSVTLTATNANGSGTSAPVIVTVFPSPIANFIASDTIACFPHNIQFTDLSVPGAGATITSWLWDFGDGHVDNTQNPVHRYTFQGNFPVALYVKNSFGCAGSAAIKTVSGYIAINGGVIPNFNDSLSSSCKPPATAFFTNLTSGPGPITYTWDFGDGSPSDNQTNPSHIYASAASYTVSLIAANNSGGCVDTIQKTVLIPAGSVQTTFNSPDSVCVGTLTTFQNTSAPTPNSSTWDFGDGSPTSNQYSATHTYGVAGNYKVSLYTTFAACSDSTSKIIHVLNPPVTDFTATNTSQCKAPLTVNFQDLSTGASGWSWNFGDGSPASNQKNPSHTYMAPGTYSVTLVTTNATGCTGSITKANFVQIIPPVVTVNLPAYGCAPFTYTPTISVTAPDGVASYAWDFGNGNTFNGANPPPQVYNAGKYIVTVTVTTNGGCISTITDTVKVGTIKPSVAFTAAPLSVCVGQNVQFTDQSTGGANQWLWEFGDGNSSSAQNALYAYTKPGTFSVKLTAYNDGCYDTLTKVNYIVVNPPLAKFGYTFNCSNKNQYIFSDSSIGAASWDWDFGDGSPHYTGGPTPPPHTYPASQLYTVSLTVTNGGCSNTYKQTINVNQKTIITANANPVCTNSSITFFTNHPTNIVSFLFDFGDGQTSGSGSGSTTHSYNTPGTYTVKVYTTDSTGCKDSSTYSMQVNGPVSNFSAPVTQGCNSLNVSFTDLSTANGAPIKTWFWDFGDGTTSTQQNPTHLYSSQGIYPVKLGVTDATGCTYTTLKSNFVTLSVPIATFTASDSMSCPNKTIQFTNNSTGGFSPTYNWDFGNGNTYTGNNPPSQTYTGVGIYTISLKMMDTYGCSSTFSKNNYLTIDTPVASFKMSDSVASCPPLLVHFTFTGHYNKTVQWTYGDGGAGDTLNTTHLYGIPGTYYPTLKVVSPGGCIASASDTVQVFGPYGALSYSPLSGCDSLTVNFNVITTGVIEFKWFFNDGIIDSTTAPFITHKYQHAGKYLPFVQLVDSTGCNVAYPGSNFIVVDSAKAGFIVDQNVLCTDGNVQFTDTSKVITTITNYYWDFGDGTTLNGNFNNPSHFYASTGLYTVKLVITTANGCQDSVIKNNFIKVVASPAIDIAGDSSQCVPAILNFSGVILVPDTSALTWAWDFDNGQTANTQNPSPQSYTKPGHYIIKATAVNSSGCPDSATADLYIYPLPTVYAGPDTTICLGQSLPLQATGAAVYNWLPPSNSSLSCTSCSNPIATPTVNTTYIVNGVSSMGCQANDTITVNVNLPVTVSVSPDDSVCVGQSVQLTASGAALYAWSPATGLSNPSIANPIASPTTTTTYQVIGSDSKYCFSDTQYVKISAFNYPTINVGPDVTILVGSSYQITGTGSSDIVSINWAPVNGLSCTDCLSPLATPQKTVTYVATVVNNGTCVASDSIKITVVCNDNNLFVPNTFSPNGDGVNDVFYVRGKGLNTVSSITIFNRWGQIVFEKKGFAPNDPSAGWDGTINGKKAPVDVYVYTIDIICDNSSLIPYHGNVTLIR